MEIVQKCTKCFEIKEISNFYKSGKSDGKYMAKCKPCHREIVKSGDKELQKLSKLKYKQNNKEKEKERDKQYRLKNKEKRKLWEQTNKEHNNRYCKEKRQTDIVFKLKMNLRSRTNKIVRGGIKPSSAIKELGCSPEEFKTYIELLFQSGMSWENYGNKDGHWSLDHIKPLSKFNLANLEEFKKASHYTNLQPMWHVDNMRKGNR